MNNENYFWIVKNQWSRTLKLNNFIDDEEWGNNNNKCVEDMKTLPEGQQNRSLPLPLKRSSQSYS